MAKIDRAAKVQLLADFDAQYAAFVTAGMDGAGRGPRGGWWAMSSRRAS